MRKICWNAINTSEIVGNHQIGNNKGISHILSKYIGQAVWKTWWVILNLK